MNKAKEPMDSATKTSLFFWAVGVVGAFMLWGVGGGLLAVPILGVAMREVIGSTGRVSRSTAALIRADGMREASNMVRDRSDSTEIDKLTGLILLSLANEIEAVADAIDRGEGGGDGE